MAISQMASFLNEWLGSTYQSVLILWIVEFHPLHCCSSPLVRQNVLQKKEREREREREGKTEKEGETERERERDMSERKMIEWYSEREK